MLVGIIIAFSGGWTVYIGAEFYKMGSSWYGLSNDFFVLGILITIAGGFLIAASVLTRRSGLHTLGKLSTPH